MGVYGPGDSLPDYMLDPPPEPRMRHQVRLIIETVYLDKNGRDVEIVRKDDIVLRDFKEYGDAERYWDETCMWIREGEGE